MAAQPIGRYCQCGCGQSIDHMRIDAMYLPTCKRLVALERQREYDRNRSKEKRERAKLQPSRLKQIALRKSVTPLSHNVYSDRQGLPPPPRQKICDVCCGMPWARLPTRFQDCTAVEKPAVAGDNGLCRGCGEAYAPEPAPDPCETLRSSAGMAAREGDVHGYQSQRGMNMKTLSREPERRSPRNVR